MVRHPVMSLRLSMIFFLIFPLTLALAAAGWYGLRLLENQGQKRMQEDIELIARTIRGPLEHALELGREGSLAQSLSSAFRIGRVYGAYVYDQHGRKVASSGPREPEVRRRRLAQLAAGGDRQGGYEGRGEEEVYSYFVPLSDSVGRNLGLLQLTRERSDFQRYLAQMRRQAVILLSLLTLSLVAIVTYAHYRIIGRNLAALSRSMGRIENGDRAHRADTRLGPRELRQLAAGMNAMLDSIALSEQEIQKRQAEQNRLEIRLRQSQKMAAIGQLAAGVAHELGSPLSLVAGKAQRMLRLELPPAAARAFRETRDAVERMENIVRQLLDFGRPNRLHYRLTSADRLAENAALQVREKAARQRIELSLDGPRPAPVMRIDQIRLEQALVNLLHNSLQVVGAGGRVRLSWFVENNRTGFRVEDDGPGVPAELRPRIFEPFFTTKPIGQGTGLGLAVVHSVITDHGGRIRIDESRWGGARFELIFNPSGMHRDERARGADEPSA